MIDRQDEGLFRKQIGRQRSPLILWFLAIVALDALILWRAASMSSSGNDAAGNGMADGFRSAFVQGDTYLLGVLTVSFLLIRHSGVRIALLVALCLTTIFEAKRLVEMTSAGWKLAALQLRIGKATDAWNNEPTPAANARTNAAIAKVVERFTGSGGGPR